MNVEIVDVNAQQFGLEKWFSSFGILLNFDSSSVAKNRKLLLEKIIIHKMCDEITQLANFQNRFFCLITNRYSLGIKMVEKPKKI